MAEADSSESDSTEERVICTLGNLKSPVLKYFGFWSINGIIVEPRDKVVSMLWELQLTNNSPTTNLKLHLENVHPDEHGLGSGTPTKQPRLDSYFIPPATSTHLQHNKRLALQNSLRSYART